MLGEISPMTHRQGDLLEPVALPSDKLMLALDTPQPALWAGYGQSVHAGGVQGLGDAPGAQVTELHDLLG